MLYALPQIELVLTLSNSLAHDARTEWVDQAEQHHSRWMGPNDALLVEAESLMHRVTPSVISNEGQRLIVKAAFTDTSSKLDAFYAELSEM